MSSLKENPQQLAQRINKIVPYFEFSDSNILWLLENEKEKMVARLLRDATLPERAEIIKNLNTRGKLNYDRYFSKIN